MRKTAAVSVAKLHDINSSLVEEQGFLDSLKVGNKTFLDSVKAGYSVS